MEQGLRTADGVADWVAPAGDVAAVRAPREGEWRWVPALTVFGAACIVYGVIWDISWHSTIGRDTFWTPAHLLIHLGGLIGGLLDRKTHV